MTAKSLAVGATAPDFELPEAFGGTVRLSEVLSRGTALLAFYPSDFGVMCAVELKMLQSLLPRFQALNATVLGISTNSVITHSAWKEHMRFTFPLLSDYYGQVSDSLGVLVGEEIHSGYMLGRCLRAVYIIDRERRVRYFWFTEDHASEPDYDELLEVCSELQLSTAPSPADRTPGTAKP
ncbi:MAG: redoxin domain-containing protein [Methanomassiliicoccus sp.]|nr:redoxin domain-containing protein [Methanomassiliicoccus sp.]